MSRGKKFFLVSLALFGLGIASFLSPASAQLVISEPAAGVDNLPPAPVTGLAADPDLGTVSVSLSWVLSVDDFVRQTAIGSDFASGGSYGATNDVAGYKVWRQTGEEDPELLAELPAGEAAYLDSEVSIGALFAYLITVFDAAGNESLPVKVEGVQLGWPGDFDGTGCVDFDDFFSFADHFGRAPDHPEWNPIFDLDGDGIIGFGDFFIFADYFGWGCG